MIQLQNITKSFGTLIANDNVTVNINRGDIHSIVGENGAGKSTLMKILYGLHKPDKGKILIDGKEENITSPGIAISKGIGMVHQHFMLVLPLTVAENVILGKEIKKFGFYLPKREIEKQVLSIAEKYNIKIDPKSLIENLGVGLQQRVEILKVLYRGAEILILDEPTAVLTPQETEELFKSLKKLKENGKTIIFISHKLKEVLSISDKITVMRQGKVIDTVNSKDISEDELAKMIVGRAVSLFNGQVSKPKVENQKETVLRVSNVSALNNRGLPALKNITFEIKKGEIFGIAGVEGNGQTELVEVITGLRKITSGKIEKLIEIEKTESKEIRKQASSIKHQVSSIKHQVSSIKSQESSLNTQPNNLSTHQSNYLTISNRSPYFIRSTGMGHIPEDRHKRGLLLAFNLSENLILGKHWLPRFSNFFIKWQSVFNYADDLIKKFDIRPTNNKAIARSLSGGNQQKAIFARETFLEPDLLIASQPTRGVDIGSIEFIHKHLLELRASGKAILLVSSELQEIISLSDRIAVMYNGEITGVFNSNEVNEEKLGAYITGLIKK